MDAYTFAIQQRTFDVHGYALNPSAMSNHQPIVGSMNQAHENGYLPVDAMRPSKALQKATKRKRKGKGDAGVVDGDDAYMGPWAAYEVEKDTQFEVDEAEDGAEEWRAEKKRREEATELAKEKMKTAREEKTIFHGMSIEWIWLMDRQGIDRLCWEDIYAHTDRSGRQAQPVRRRYTAKRLLARQVYTYLDWTQQGCFIHQTLPYFWSSPPIS
jgi:hypothetical protein